MNVFVPWGCIVYGSSTDKLRVVQLPHLSIDEAIDFNAAKGSIMEHSTEGMITASVKHGKIPVIEWTVRKLRQIRSVKQP